MSVDDIESVELIPDPELDFKAPVDLLDELTEKQRADYEAVIFDGIRQTEQADERDVTQAVVSRNIKAARRNLRRLAKGVPA